MPLCPRVECHLPGRGVGRRRRLRVGCGWLGSKDRLLIQDDACQQELPVFLVEWGWEGGTSVPGQAAVVWIGVMSPMSMEEEVWWIVLPILCAWT